MDDEGGAAVASRHTFTFTAERAERRSSGPRARNKVTCAVGPNLHRHFELKLGGPPKRLKWTMTTTKPGWHTSPCHLPDSRDATWLSNFDTIIYTPRAFQQAHKRSQGRRDQHRRDPRVDPSGSRLADDRWISTTKPWCTSCTNLYLDVARVVRITAFFFCHLFHLRTFPKS